VSAAAVGAGLAGVLALAAGHEALASIELERLPRAIARVLEPLLRAGRDGSAPDGGERRRLALLGAGTLWAMGLIAGGPLVALAAAALGPWLGAAVVRARRRRWRARLARAAPDVARALGDALGAGHSISVSIGEAARGMRGPAGDELRAVALALGLGARLETALERLRERAGAPGYDAIVAAILLQRDTGGALATLLRELASSLADAARLEQDARAATAQARATALLVCALPLCAAALAELGSPGFLSRLLRSPLSASLTVAAVALQGLALLAVRRIASVRA